MRETVTARELARVLNEPCPWMLSRALRVLGEERRELLSGRDPDRKAIEVVNRTGEGRRRGPGTEGGEAVARWKRCELLRGCDGDPEPSAVVGHTRKRNRDRVHRILPN